MKLECACKIKKKEEKKSKSDKSYLDVSVDEGFNKFDSHIFIFSPKMIERFNDINIGDSVVLIYEYFWSKKSEKNVMWLRDVVVE